LEAPHLRLNVDDQPLPNYYWIGGSPCSGKSSIASLLAQKHDLQLYVCDDHYPEHIARADPATQPHLAHAAVASWNEIWSRTVDVATSDEIEFYREEFGMILEDIRSMPAGRPILAEGAALLPELVAPFVSDRNQAIWIVPTEQFQLHHYSRREWIHDILAQCENPESAFATWMGRDAQFAKIVAEDARRRGFRVIIVDGSRSITELAGQVEEHFGLGPGVGRPNNPQSTIRNPQ
jgi:2-phosphoglycerate kinase